MDKVFRPKPGKRKINSKEHFELCYLRHQYFRKTKYNPSKDEMQPYVQIASHMAKNTYYTYKNLFGLIGFDCEDLVSIAHIHLVSFLGLFSLEKMPEKYEEFVDAYHKINAERPSENDVMNKNKANFTLFLKQRMEDVVRICRQKARNIKGIPTEEFFFYYGPKNPPKHLRELIDNYEKYGYRKLDTATYKTIRKRVRVDDSHIFKFDGNYYVSVPVEQKALSVLDFSGAGMDPYDSIHNMNPEQIYFAAQEQGEWEKRQEEFEKKTKIRKVNIVKKFIKNHKDNIQYKEEVRAARKFLRNIGA